jgi:hypothetical protein
VNLLVGEETEFPLLGVRLVLNAPDCTSFSFPPLRGEMGLFLWFKDFYTHNNGECEHVNVIDAVQGITWRIAHLVSYLVGLSVRKLANSSVSGPTD